MFFTFFVGLVIVMYIISTLWITPKTNEMFSEIWSEEEHPKIKRETQERLNDLFVDGDIPAETALVIAAREESIEEKELLAMFGALDAKDLKAILRARGPTRVVDIFKVLDGISKRGMR